MENNTAVVVKLKNISAIEGADKIKRADIYMNDVKITQVVVGSDAIEDSIQVYFDSNLCLFEKLIEDYRNTFKDSTEEVKPDLARYLGKNYRVRTIKLKGIISNGLIVEPYHFYKYFKNEKEAISTLVEGYSFDKIGETNICKKYIVPINIPSTGKKKKGKGKTSSRMIPGSFNFHIDTDNLLKNSHKIKPDDVISLSSKWHGCVSEKTLVETSNNEFLTIGEVVNKKLNVNIKAFNLKTNEIEFVPIDSYYFKKNDGDWFEIELENGEKIEITSNNPIWLPELNCYRQTKDLIVGDTILFEK